MSKTNVEEIKQLWFLQLYHYSKYTRIGKYVFRAQQKSEGEKKNKNKKERAKEIYKKKFRQP